MNLLNKLFIANHRLFFSFLLAATAFLPCHASEVIYLKGPEGRSRVNQQVEIASDFYGLDLKTLVVDNKNKVPAAMKTLRESRSVALIIDAEVLPNLNQKETVSALSRKDAQNIPLLIANISESTSPDLLKQWSGGTITSCLGPVHQKSGSLYSIADVDDVARQLSGKTLPLAEGEIHALVLNGSHDAQWLMALQANGSQPFFARARTGKQEIYFATAFIPSRQLSQTAFHDESAVFSALAPTMMFLRYAAGDSAWHFPAHYANLTIDDPWLREPYGYVDYSRLFGEMQQHNFHTTIAFIPWNFDRSQPEVVSLLRAHPERFSICVHGDNHDHQEFRSYAQKPLEGQAANIRQALGRMEKFHTLTQLSYDPVMVFPHSIAPAETLGALKRYNFLATVNGDNIPLGSAAPGDPEFALRPVSLAFSNFASVERYSVEVPVSKEKLAIDAFLGNPMLFYTHQAYFAGGIGSFNSVADMVNRLQPDTQWKSLGSIAEHLYLERRREDGNYDIKTFSSNLLLENAHEKDATYFVDKEEDFAVPLTVFVDGAPYHYDKAEDHLRLVLTVPAGATRKISIHYENGFDVNTVDISKSSWRVAALRYLSDFRDLALTKSAAGRKFSLWYLNMETNGRQRLALLIICSPALVLICVLGVWMRRKRMALRKHYN